MSDAPVEEVMVYFPVILLFMMFFWLQHLRNQSHVVGG